jgi:hypothetical protein
VRRKLCNLAAAMSLVLCVAACVLWVRSFFRADYIGFHDGSYHGVKLESVHGSVAFHVDPRMTRPLRATWTAQPTSGSVRRRLLGQFYFSRGYWGVIVAVPYWFVVPICLAGPAVVWRRRRLRRHRAELGLCIACGFDLRATPDRCPECGAVSEPAGITTAA